jgi:hypothetical protein
MTTTELITAPRRGVDLARHLRRLAVTATLIATLNSLAVAVPQRADAATSRDPVGNVEAFIASSGAISARGWAFDPDSSLSTRVEFRSDGVLRTTVLAHDPRADIARAYPRAGDHRGFNARFTIPNGTHVVCAIAVNVAAGMSKQLACRSFTMKNNPIGDLNVVRLAPLGIQVAGWALDPNSRVPIRVHIQVDGVTRVATTASRSRTDVARAYPYFGAAHGYDLVIRMTDGPHSVCAWAINIGEGSAITKLKCLAITATRSPIGGLNTASRVGGTSTTVAVSGWALDPDTRYPIGVNLTVDGVTKKAVTLNVASAWVGGRYPTYGPNHSYSTSLVIDPAQHVLCMVAVNVAAGANRTLGCRLVPSTGATTPTAPKTVAVWPGSGSVDLTWKPATATSFAVTGYTIVASPGGRTVKVSAAATRATVTGLKNGVSYTFTIRATNQLGAGTAAVIVARPSDIPPQFTPAPVSTSHYPRNWTGNLATDTALMRRMGTLYAATHPAGHRYIVLLDIGGQDERRKGVLLSATSRFVTYSHLVAAVNAYVDGYVTTQRTLAPLLLAVGTNNDIDVSFSAGVSWARNVVDPIRAHAARYPGVTLAGANDMEPGFSASVAQSRLWLSGYLAGTTAKYVFNGSADGCSTGVVGGRCNNGWSQADLQWLGGGAAAARSVNLPQIYNNAMALQWRNISVAGTRLGKARLYFGGPLTEVAACGRPAVCYSITNVDAWTKLRAALSSNPSSWQYDMPYGTDLRIN